MKTTTRAQRVWCSLIGREVQVEFERHGFFGLGPRTGVRACAAFDPPTAVACQRCCLDATFRRQWPSALPLLGR